MMRLYHITCSVGKRKMVRIGMDAHTVCDDLRIMIRPSIRIWHKHTKAG